MKLKEERKNITLDMLQKEEVITVSQVKKVLNVTDMTVRRDLKELEDSHQLIRIHGGAKRVANDVSYNEYTHSEKKKINTEDKKAAAKKAASLIVENDLVFIGPGTTCEFIYDYIDVNRAKIITNSFSVFMKFQADPRFEVILVGGRLRQFTKTFVGVFANQVLGNMKVKKAFLGTNGINGLNITTANEEEGTSQKIILDNAQERYIVCDHTKIGQEAFYTFYPLDEVTAIITDENLPDQTREEYGQFTTILTK